MSKTDPTVAHLIAVAQWALLSVRGHDRRVRICRTLSGWFAQRAASESEAAEIEHRKTPLIPPPNRED